LETASDQTSHKTTKVEMAQDLLEATHQLLSSKAEALRSFSKRLGARPMPSAAKSVTPISLLQISTEENDITGLPAINLPDVKRILEKPIQVMKTMTSDVQALQHGLLEVQGWNEHAVHIQKQEYEDTLEGQEVENHKLEKQVEQLSSDIKALQSSNRDLRSQALQLVTKSVALRSHISSLQQNMTTVQEVAAKSLVNTDENLHNSSELQVLIELDSNDQARAEHELHKSRLQAVASGDHFAMLQVSSAFISGPRQSAEELLGMMTSTLSDLAVEQNASLTSLMQSFEKESRKNEAHKQALLDEMATLNATISYEQNLNDRLTVSAAHFKQLHDSMTKQMKSLQSFLAYVGGDQEHKKEHGTKRQHGKKIKKAAEEKKKKSTSSQTASDQTSHKTTKVETAQDDSVHNEIRQLTNKLEDPKESAEESMKEEKSSIMSWMLR